MEFISPDTSPDAAHLQREVWRRMPAETKFRQILDASTSMREITLAGIRQRHPDYDEHRVKMAWLRMTMDRNAFIRLFPNEDVVP